MHHFAFLSVFTQNYNDPSYFQLWYLFVPPSLKKMTGWLNFNNSVAIIYLPRNRLQAIFHSEIIKGDGDSKGTAVFPLLRANSDQRAKVYMAKIV